MVLKTTILFVTMALFIALWFLVSFQIRIAPRQRFEYDPSTQLYEYNENGKRFFYSARYKQPWFRISQTVSGSDTFGIFTLTCRIEANKESTYSQNMKLVVEEVERSLREALTYIPNYDVYPEFKPEKDMNEYIADGIKSLNCELNKKDYSLSDVYFHVKHKKYRIC